LVNEYKKNFDDKKSINCEDENLFRNKNKHLLPDNKIDKYKINDIYIKISANDSSNFVDKSNIFDMKLSLDTENNNFEQLDDYIRSSKNQTGYQIIIPKLK